MSPPRIRVKVAPDGLSATLVVRKGVEAGPDELARLLQAAGVCRGIDEELRTRTEARLRDTQYECDGVVIARGQAPVRGEDSRLERYFAQGLQPGTHRSDGTMDFRERGRFHPVRREENFAVVVAATPGRAGYDVCGKILPARAGRALCLELGEGVERRRNGLFARRDGVVVETGRRIDVLTHQEHDAAVDLRSGNLRSAGSLLIKGDICQGFVAQVDGDLHVTGTVAGGQAIAGANLWVDGGIVGRYSGRASAGGTLKAHHVEGAILWCQGRVEIEGDVVSGELYGQEIIVQGCVRGGTLQAEGGIRVGKAGSRHAAGPVLKVGQLLDDDGGSRVQRQRAGARLQRPRHQRWNRAKSARRQMSAQRHSTARSREIRAKQRELIGRAKIDIASDAYPGTMLIFGEVQFSIDTHLPASSFRYDAQLGRVVRTRFQRPSLPTSPQEP